MSEEKVKSIWLSLSLKNKGKDGHADLLSLLLLVAVDPSRTRAWVPPSSEQEVLSRSQYQHRAVAHAKLQAKWQSHIRDSVDPEAAATRAQVLQLDRKQTKHIQEDGSYRL